MNIAMTVYKKYYYPSHNSVEVFARLHDNRARMPSKNIAISPNNGGLS